MNNIDIIKRRLTEEQPYTLTGISYLVDKLSLFFPGEIIYELATNLLNLSSDTGGRLSDNDVDEFVKLCKPKSNP